MSIRHLDLFSGIGGFALACQWTGLPIETVGFCEIDPWAQQVLAKNFPGVPCHGDVKTLTTEQYGTIDLITGGYPCQPFSNAGLRRGAEDKRHLWPFMLQHIQNAHPKWVLAENVAGHISMGLDVVCNDLEAEGYEVGAAVLPACSKGAPHKRDRVWVMGVRQDLRSNVPHSTGCAVSECAQESFPRKHNISVQFGRVGEAVGISRELCKPLVPGVVDGVSAGLDGHRKQRVIGLGNAICPAVAADLLHFLITTYPKS